MSMSSSCPSSLRLRTSNSRRCSGRFWGAEACIRSAVSTSEIRANELLYYFLFEERGVIRLEVLGAHTHLHSTLCRRCPQGPAGCCAAPPAVAWADIGRISALG